MEDVKSYVYVIYCRDILGCKKFDILDGCVYKTENLAEEYLESHGLHKDEDRKRYLLENVWVHPLYMNDQYVIKRCAFIE